MSSRKGFTLVELLVVIGIIALLISILLPSLARARQAAVSLACASNMRQVGQGIAMYQMDNRGLFPWNRIHNGTTTVFWWDAIAPMMGIQVNDRGGTALHCPGATVPSGFTHYSVHPRLMPSYHPDERRGDWMVGGNYWWENDPARSLRPYKINFLPRSTETVILFEGAQLLMNGAWPSYGTATWELFNLHSSRMGWTGMLSHPWDNGATRDDSWDQGIVNYNLNVDVTGWGPGEGLGMIRWRHNANTTKNVLFADGHVESLKARFNGPVIQDGGELLGKNVLVERNPR